MYKSFNSKRNFKSRQSNNRNRRVDYIDPSKFIKVATAAQQEQYQAKHQFSDFKLVPLLSNNLSAKGYIVPSPIQDQAIPEGLAGKDIIGIASTGTGKTAAFAIPILQKLLTTNNTSALIIAPTRELAIQIEDECRIIAKSSGLLGALLIGGTNIYNQQKDLSFSPRIVIGTPGRIKDHINRGDLRLQAFNLIVLDEVDRMLDMGFINDVTEILSNTNSDRQSFFFSATMDNRVNRLIDNYSKNPYTISLRASSASESVHQNVIKYQDRSDKIDKLHDLLISEGVKKALVFDETQRGVERLNKELIARGFLAESIHGGKTQGQRQRALTKFKDGHVNILVATDVAARGIDVADITHVVNYSIPKEYNDYIHRIGRAGRAGKIGHALTFIAG